MNKSNNRIVINGPVHLDTVTMYSDNQILVNACPWACDVADEVAPDGTVKLKGCTTIEPGAGVTFRPYRQGTGSRYKVLFETEHCTVLHTNGGTVIEKWRFSNKMTSAEIREARQWENQKLDAFYKSRREETKW